nr:uncharacterized protein LOC101136085 [Gorilla gorilla gorilla]
MKIWGRCRTWGPRECHTRLPVGVGWCLGARARPSGACVSRQGSSAREPGAHPAGVMGGQARELREGTGPRPQALQGSHRASYWHPGTAGSFGKKRNAASTLPFGE